MRLPTRRGHDTRHDNRNHWRRQPRRDGCTAPRERRRGSRPGRERRAPGASVRGRSRTARKRSLGPGRNRRFRHRRPRRLAGPAEERARRAREAARRQGRRRPDEPDRVPRRTDDPDAAGRPVVQLGRRRPAPRRRALREGIRVARRDPACGHREPRTERRALLRDGRRRGSDDRQAVDSHSRLRADGRGRARQRRTDGRSQRRSPRSGARPRRSTHGTRDGGHDMSTFVDYAPIPRSAFGPALNEQGYHVGRVERNLYWVTDGVYQCAFLTTSDGVVLLDAPPTIGHNIQRAIDEIASANGVSYEVEYLIYSHHHADHVGASSLFDKNVTRIGHEETRRLLLRDDDPARPPNEETFQNNW